MTSSPSLSPQQRLDNSRQAIVRHMGHAGPDTDESDDSHGASDSEIDASAGTWDLIKQAAGSWWHGHPAHMALGLAKPMIQTYAEEKPLKLLAICAGVGAAAVVIRPWRLISLTGLALALLKSSEMSGVMGSLLSAGRKPHKPP